MYRRRAACAAFIIIKMLRRRLAVCIYLGASPALVVKAANSFSSLAHRMEEVGRIGRVIFINDSKATNADAAARALSAFDDVFWIAGGKPKEGGVSSLKAGSAPSGPLI